MLQSYLECKEQEEKTIHQLVRAAEDGTKSLLKSVFAHLICELMQWNTQPISIKFDLKRSLIWKT